MRQSKREPAVEQLTEQIDAISHSLGTVEDLDPLLDQIGDARYVLLGEASHGTSDYYAWRARISQRLIREKGFSFIAVEGDWPDCYRLNRYVKNYADAGNSAYDVLQVFNRWPTWMWANWEIVALAEWLRQHNAEASSAVGFYGLDVYSLWESMEAIIDYLERVDPEAAQIARRAYLCFEPYSEDAQAYAWSTAIVPESCEEEVIDLLQEVRRKTEGFDQDPEAAFNAEQNARVMVNAEKYYRTMVRGGADSWNVRDHHMMDALNHLMEHHGPNAKAIVWAHNTHVGDARATDMANAGMVNIGQLARQQHRQEGVVLVGFGSHHGSVIAGQEWGAPMERMPVPRAQASSWEDVLHCAGPRDILLTLHSAREEPEFLDARGHRAIGVVYHPEREHYGNYVPTVLPQRYDAFIYLEETDALHPLHLEPEGHKLPEMYPWGL